MRLEEIQRLGQKNTSKYTKLARRLDKVSYIALILILFSLFLENGPLKFGIFVFAAVEACVSLPVKILDVYHRIKKG